MSIKNEGQQKEMIINPLTLNLMLNWMKDG
jgi:hypothetical protein